MAERSQDDFAHERQTLDAMHGQNEAQRDGFVGLAHTALFAASISFVGDVAPLAKAIWRPLLLMGWSASVIGLLALTLSFGAARRSIDARRAALLDPHPPSSRWPDRLNAVALWSFPVALLSLFSFVTANVVYADDRQAAPSSAAELRAKGSRAAATSAESRRPIQALDRHRATATRPGCTDAGADTTAAEEVKVGAGQKPVENGSD